MSELDSRYYAILESLSKLQSTLSSLQQISSATRRLSQHFEAGARELDADVQRDIADFGGALEARQVKIEALGERVRRGRERVGQLDQRLGTVSDMVTVWERKEQEWRTGVRREFHPITFALLHRISNTAVQALPLHAFQLSILTSDTRKIKDV